MFQTFSYYIGKLGDLDNSGIYTGLINNAQVAMHRYSLEQVVA